MDYRWAVNEVGQTVFYDVNANIGIGIALDHEMAASFVRYHNMCVDALEAEIKQLREENAEMLQFLADAKWSVQNGAPHDAHDQA